MSLRKKLIRLAFEQPSLRPEVLGLLNRHAWDMSVKPSRSDLDDIKGLNWQDWNWQALPDDLWKYFEKPAGTVVVPLRNLNPTRAREKGIANANKFMWLAYHGLMGRRKPLSLRDNGDGTYEVLDGNSTFANAKKSGWKALAGKVEEIA